MDLLSDAFCLSGSECVRVYDEFKITVQESRVALLLKQSALITAIRWGNFDLTKLIVDDLCRGDVNRVIKDELCRGYEEAICNHFTEIVKWMSSLFTYRKDGLAKALYMWKDDYNKEIADSILKTCPLTINEPLSGSEVYEIGSGWTPVTLASRYHNVNAMLHLVDNNADLFYTDGHRHNALSACVMDGYDKSIYDRLCDAGLRWLYSGGLCPSCYTVIRGHPATVVCSCTIGSDRTGIRRAINSFTGNCMGYYNIDVALRCLHALTDLYTISALDAKVKALRVLVDSRMIWLYVRYVSSVGASFLHYSGYKAPAVVYLLGDYCHVAHDSGCPVNISGICRVLDDLAPRYSTLPDRGKLCLCHAVWLCVKYGFHESIRNTEFFKSMVLDGSVLSDTVSQTEFAFNEEYVRALDALGVSVDVRLLLLLSCDDSYVHMRRRDVLKRCIKSSGSCN